LRDAHYAGAKRLEHGAGYQYPHDHADGVVSQDYLGVDKVYYVPTDRGAEARMAEHLQKFRSLRCELAADEEAARSSEP
jgi:putative ATPase